MREKKLQFCLPFSFTKNDADSLPKVYLPRVAVKFVYKEFVYIGFVYVIWRWSLFTRDFLKFIYQGYIGVNLPKVHLRKPGLQAFHPYPDYPILGSTALREQMLHPLPPSTHPKCSFIPVIYFYLSFQI